MKYRIFGPQPTLMWHLSRAIIYRALFFSVIFISLLEILGLLDKMPVILQRHQGASGVAYYCFLRIPSLFELGLPLSMLLSAVFLLVQMNQRSEIAVYRAAGLSTLQLFGLMTPAAVLVAILGLFLKTEITPKAESAYQRWWASTTLVGEDVARNLWFHMPDRIVHVSEITNRGRQLQDVTIYRHGKPYRLDVLTAFPDLIFEAGVWHAPQASGWENKDGHLTTRTTRVVETHLDLPKPDALLRLLQNPPVFSVSRLWASLTRTTPTSQPSKTYQIALLSYISLPIKLCVMLFAALPVVFIQPRMGTKSLLPVAALASGVIYMIGQGFFDALANAGTLPVFFSITAAPLLTLFLVGAWLIKLESG